MVRDMTSVASEHTIVAGIAVLNKVSDLEGNSRCNESRRSTVPDRLVRVLRVSLRPWMICNFYYRQRDGAPTVETPILAVGLGLQIVVKNRLA